MEMERFHPKNWLGQAPGKTLVVHLDKEDWQKFVPISDYMKLSPSQLGNLLLKQGLLQYQQKGKIQNNTVQFTAPRSVTKSLTNREIEILKLAAQGTSNKAIASDLGIREQTAKNHFSAILHKLNAQNRTQAVVLALAQDLVNMEN